MQFGGLTSQQRRPFPEFQNIAYNTFGVSSIYHSLQVKLEHRFTDGLTYLLSYTWSRSLDNGSGLFPGDNPTVSSSFRVQNPYNMAGERALSADDQAHRLTATYTYDLPWGPGRAMLNSNVFGQRFLAHGNLAASHCCAADFRSVLTVPKTQRIPKVADNGRIGSGMEA